MTAVCEKINLLRFTFSVNSCFLDVFFPKLNRRLVSLGVFIIGLGSSFLYNNENKSPIKFYQRF